MEPVSVFIMDITNSSSAANGEMLSNYLGKLETYINKWYEGIGSVQIKHRSGDELILLAEGYSTAFITAFYISSIWEYEKHLPYFGLAYGRLDKKVEEIDIEKWIHPLAKQARSANDQLKKQKNRETFCYQIPEREPGLQTLINGMLSLQNVLRMEQTDVQRLVCSLYLIYGKQNTVAQLLDRSAPTVYSHFKKGHCEQILRSFHEIVSVLDGRQASDFFPDMQNGQLKLLEESIRTNIKSQVQNIFSL
ncbi:MULTISPECIES: sigma-70 family RNA polymerase sigma factor [Mesobacillus]|uniref:Sigma-70 family RNA polymerase sigma factor n=1 Tax=Mesobacillus selenatarsenatis TaxID=388741 RepID=A0A846TJ88_9BACI|nr:MULTISPECIES: sigma-70 family RNA polymerase sigma factor [Mesobacillus]NKE06064.1 sigma-70 family RNA polymerase sigma factor [Mesobacillus selenatarsenatis]